MTDSARTYTAKIFIRHQCLEEDSESRWCYDVFYIELFMGGGPYSKNINCNSSFSSMYQLNLYKELNFSVRKIKT
jgi:hypothetical protein